MSGVRFLTVSDGPATERSTNSGVALGITTALRRSPRAEVIVSVDSRLSGVRRAVLLAATIRPSKAWWWYNFNFGWLSTYIRSVARERVARRLHKRGAIDAVLHVRNIYRPSRIPYVAFIDSTSAMAGRGWKAWKAPTKHAQRVQDRTERDYYRRALCVVTAGQLAAESVIADYGVSADRVAAIGGGVNFDPLPAVNHPAREPFTILWVGLDFERKGGDTLLEAFRLVRKANPNARLLMVGTPSRGDSPGVEWLGEIRDRDVLAGLYSRAGIFCLPARHEPYGLVVQEAMAFGLPCVVSDTGALSTIVEDGVTGRVVGVDQPVELAAALAQLGLDAREAQEFGSRGRAKVEVALTWGAVADRMLDAIEHARESH